MNQPSVEITEPAAGSPRVADGFRPAPRRDFVAGLILALVTLMAHGQALWEGPFLFLDDHLHVSRLRSPDWSVKHLLDATTITPAEFMDAWWQEQPIRWRYARPVSMLLAKVVYQLSGGSVKALHGLSLALHLIGAVLVYRLCLKLTHRPGWSLIGGVLFVIHSHSVYSVGWLAAQNSVLQTVLTLAALLGYVRASGLEVYAGRKRETGLDGPAPPSAVRHRLYYAEPDRPVPALSLPWFVLTLLCWLAALFSRENALVFPVFAAAFDLVFGGWRHARRRVGGFLVMAVIAAAFAFWRLKVYYEPMPAFYVRSYDGPDYPWWWLAKLLHWITGVIWLSPLMIGPSARFNPFREVPGDCLLMIAIVAVMSAGYYLACRKARGWWLWPAWVFLALLPVVPVFAGPQSAYMPAAGWAVAMVLGPALRHEIRPRGIGRWCPGVALYFLVSTSVYMPLYQMFWQAVRSAEHLTVAQMAADPPAPSAGEVFLINVPFVNVYAGLHLAEELSATSGKTRGLRCHVLTYAPNVLRMEEDCRLEQLDAYSFRLSIAGRGYFSGALGRFLIEAMRPSGRLRAGDTCHREWFDVHVTRANAEGVQELLFRFHEPLASPKFCFYLGTNQQPAVRVHFWGSDESLTDVAARPARDAVSLAEVHAADQRLESGQLE
ncbi:MAG: hypothetical protein HRF43_16010, partial [Phycisphaerae bacterium]